MEAGKLSLRISSDCAGRRLDQALAQLLPQYSRSRIQQWIRGDAVRVEGRAAPARHPVCGGERVEIRIPREGSDGHWQAEAIPLAILYEDEELLIVDKPPGLVVHPGAGNREHTLLNALLYRFPGLTAVPRAGIVHRLDKDTSGLMAVARTGAAHVSLVGQLKERSVRREYRALVAGRVSRGGQVELPIGRHPRRRTRMAVVAAGRPALTRYRVLERFPGYSWLSLRLETGRTHQIRVHMAHLGHPVAGDPLYGRRPVAAAPLLPRQALHARALALTHPRSGKRMRWEAPLPADMARLLADLRKDAGSDAGA